MDFTVSVTEAEKEALMAAFPGNSVEEALAMLLRSQMERKYRVQLKRAKVVAFQGLKKPKSGD
jgi:hypothetical protein